MPPTLLGRRWPANSIVWSTDGALLAVIAPHGVDIREGEKLEQVQPDTSLLQGLPCIAASFHGARLLSCIATEICCSMQVAHLDLPNVVAVAFSPKSTYLTTFQRPQPAAGNTEKNLKVTLSPPNCHFHKVWLPCPKNSGVESNIAFSNQVQSCVEVGDVDQCSFLKASCVPHVPAAGLALEEEGCSHAAIPEELQQGHMASHLLHRG